MSKEMRLFSSGGGVQSTAVLVLSARGDLPYRVHVFANTGDDSEHPDVLAYVRNVSQPYAITHGIQFVEIAKGGRTLYQSLMSTNRSVPIPARMSNGAPGNRACTVDYKIRQIDRWIATNGGRDADIVTVGLGISTDEIQRARRNGRQWIERNRFWKQLEYPLIDLDMSRADCLAVIRDASLPPAPRSACYFCPFHSPMEWRRLDKQRPDLFARAVQIEEHINHKRVALLKKDKVWLHPSLAPLDLAVQSQMDFDELEGCEGGFCLT